MVYNIYYNTLNKELKKAINSKTISSDDLKKIYEGLKEKNNKKKKTINIVMVCVILMFAIMGFPILTKSNDTGLIKFMLLLLIPSLVIIYFLVYFTQIGLIKMQFNNAIKKNYPELAKELHL